ncbi:uncharacterized protein C1orf127 homolog [Ornithorhynchus anatinus]|uniref:CIROZ beta domain-containing protein n=1 Tax=Ornithorhynchus anatinus TaxID=9258 RepID=A0A6I8P8B5_ORNAN|nr:uncharacterized protein C1orf127 homolog [Ornithorhynchus anatinus]
MIFTWTFPRLVNNDSSRQVVEISEDDVECFSDYMALWIPKSHADGLKQWLSRTLHMPMTWESLEWPSPLLAQCGYSLHPDPNGDYIFQVLYTACFVQQEEANYRLEIRIFQKGAKGFGQRDSYIMKCPVITSWLGQESIRCEPEFIQVSRPLPQRNPNGQDAWLLSLRGEMVASLEDASLLGLYVETNTTTITVQGSRQPLLQRREVRGEMNMTVEILPLWMVQDNYAYSLEASCPLVSSQPGSEVLVHIPKRRLGLVKRGSHALETLSLKNLHVNQSNTFTVTENRHFVVIAIPATAVLQTQQCQEAQEPLGWQAFYRLDLSLEFAEVPRPVHWTVENFFNCIDKPVPSGTEPSFSTAARNATCSSPSPSHPSNPPLAGCQPAPSSQVTAWTSGRNLHGRPSGVPENTNPEPFLELGASREQSLAGNPAVADRTNFHLPSHRATEGTLRTVSDPTVTTTAIPASPSPDRARVLKSVHFRRTTPAALSPGPQPLSLSLRRNNTRTRMGSLAKQTIEAAGAPLPVLPRSTVAEGLTASLQSSLRLRMSTVPVKGQDGPLRTSELAGTDFTESATPPSEYMASPSTALSQKKEQVPSLNAFLPDEAGRIRESIMTSPTHEVGGWKHSMTTQTAFVFPELPAVTASTMIEKDPTLPSVTPAIDPKGTKHLPIVSFVPIKSQMSPVYSSSGPATGSSLSPLLLPGSETSSVSLEEGASATPAGKPATLWPKQKASLMRIFQYPTDSRGVKVEIQHGGLKSAKREEGAHDSPNGTRESAGSQTEFSRSDVPVPTKRTPDFPQVRKKGLWVTNQPLPKPPGQTALNSEPWTNVPLLWKESTYATAEGIRKISAAALVEFNSSEASRELLRASVSPPSASYAAKHQGRLGSATHSLPAFSSMDNDHLTVSSKSPLTNLSQPALVINKIRGGRVRAKPANSDPEDFEMQSTGSPPGPIGGLAELAGVQRLSLWPPWIPTPGPSSSLFPETGPPSISSLTEPSEDPLTDSLSLQQEFMNTTLSAGTGANMPTGLQTDAAKSSP